MTKGCERKLTYCFITCNLNQLPKLLCDNKDAAAVCFNYFYAKNLLSCARNRNCNATFISSTRDHSQHVPPFSLSHSSHRMMYEEHYCDDFASFLVKNAKIVTICLRPDPERNAPRTPTQRYLRNRSRKAQCISFKSQINLYYILSSWDNQTIINHSLSISHHATPASLLEVIFPYYNYCCVKSRQTCLHLVSGLVYGLINTFFAASPSFATHIQRTSVSCE